MKISIAIMAHPKRAIPAKRLWRELEAMPFIDPYVIYDDKNEEWDTGEQALRYGIGKADWHVVLQDDAILTADFYNNLVGAINNVPTKVLFSLYTGKVKPLAQRVQIAVDKARDGDWLNFYMLLWGVGIAIPSAHIEPMLDFINEERWNDTPYDSRLGVFYQRNMLPIYYAVPSLVDHDDSLGTLLPDHATEAPRVAHRLATGRISWGKRVIDI